MAKRHLLMLGFLLGAGALFSGCSDAKLVTLGGDAGATGEAESSGEGGEGGETAYEFPPSLNPQAVVVVGPAPSVSTHLLVGASDFLAHKGEIASITLGTGVVDDTTTFPDGDLVATSSAGVGFALERTNDKVHLLEGSKASTTFDLVDPGTDDAPVDSKAYVPLYNQSLIAILDLSEGRVSRRIDLNAYNAPGDSDHSAEIAEGVFDPNGKIVYFVLQRIDTKSYDAKLHLPCSKSPGLIVGIDTKTDAVVDLNGKAAGKAIELQLVNQRSLSINADGTALYMLADGCYEGDTKARRGVEVVDLLDGSTTVAYRAEGSDYLAKLILTGGEDALLQSLDADYAPHWNKLAIQAGTLGAEISDVPDAAIFDGTDLLGVEVTDQGGAVLRYDLATGATKVISETSWAGQYSSGISSALVQ